MKKYKLTFVKEDGNWYIDLPEWTGNHEDLQMVAGADKLCDWFAQGKDKINVEIVTTSLKIRNEDKQYICLKKRFEELGGYVYDIEDDPTGIYDLWICEVTKYVLGGFPNRIYIKKCGN